MAYQIKIKRSAEKELEKLPLEAVILLRKHILLLANNPFPFGYKKMKGFKNQFRIRIRQYRVIYGIEHQHLIIQILKIGDRKDIYR